MSHLLVSEGLLALAFGRLEDGELNSRGFSNPWTTSRFNYRTVCKDGDFNTDGLSSPRRRCRSASLQTPFLLLFCFHGLKSPRLFAFGFASFRRLVLYVIFDSLADLISALCLMFCFWFVFRCFANGQWLTANGCFVVLNSATKLYLYFVKQNKNGFIFAYL